MSTRIGDAIPASGNVEQRGKHLALQTKCAAWLYVPPFFELDSELPMESLQIAEQEARDALAGLWHLATCTWVNPPDVAQNTANRLWQLRLAQSVGLTIPDTIVTNDLKTAREFITGCSSGAIIKDLATPYAAVGSQVYTSYTRTIASKDLDDLTPTSFAPCLLQERVPKKHEVRAYVIGNKVLAAGIETSIDSNTEDDYRRRRYEVSIWPYELPPVLVQQCLEVVSKAGLRYAGIDLIITPDGRPVFLELGPYSSWIWAEKRSGLPLTSAFVDLLLELEDLVD